jgi:hypothetical protein
MSDEANTIIPMISLAIAGLAVFFSPLISMRIASKQQETSLKVSNKQIIAPIRQNWINELRHTLADLNGKCAHYWAAGYEEREDEEYRYITEQIAKLELYINPNEREHVALLEHVKNMTNAIEGGSPERDKEFWLAHEASVKQSQLILKKEWERVKNEI